MREIRRVVAWPSSRVTVSRASSDSTGGIIAAGFAICAFLRESAGKNRLRDAAADGELVGLTHSTEFRINEFRGRHCPARHAVHRLEAGLPQGLERAPKCV